MSKDDSLRDLIERVGAAEGPDRDIDCDIALAIDGGEIVWLLANGTMDQYPARKYESPNHVGGFGKAPVPNFTGSMDAVLTLIDHADEWELSTIYNIARATVGLNRDHQTAWPGYGEHKAGNPVLALLSASLRAHMTQEKPNGTE